MTGGRSVAVFDVEDEEDTYFFAKGPVRRDRGPLRPRGGRSWTPGTRCVRTVSLAERGYYPATRPICRTQWVFSALNMSQRDIRQFRNSWQYMPRFRVLDQADFATTMAVFLMLFVFVAIVCFAAMVVIALYPLHDHRPDQRPGL